MHPDSKRRYADGGVVVRRDVDDRYGNSGGLEAVPEFDPQLIVQIDIEDNANCRLEVVVVLERFRGGKQNAVVTIFPQQAP